MSDNKLGLFNGEDMPDVQCVWNFYKDGLKFNDALLGSSGKAYRQMACPHPYSMCSSVLLDSM